MGYILCTAEKPSVASDIARVIGATKRCNGYFEGNGYRVTWAIGHLVGLAEPEQYGYMELKEIWNKEKPDNMIQALDELPIFPSNFKLVVLPKTKQQFEIMKSLMNDNECDSIIDCGDAGAEGHILQWFIREKAACKKPIKRFIATSMTDEAIKDAMNNLQNIEKYLPIINAEYCKKKADWILGMSMSRGASISYNAKIDVGRVQSPTLYFIVKRYIDVLQFKSKEYYTFKAETNKGFSIYWNKDYYNFLTNDMIDDDNRLVNKDAAITILNDINNEKKVTVTVLDTKKRMTERPLLYDITELERDSIRMYGYTADKVLSIAQSLYEKYKITTYPRTDSRYLTHDLAPLMEQRIKEISKIPKYSDLSKTLLLKGLNLDKKVIDDSKVQDHHAIITTSKLATFDISLLTEEERNILELVISRMLVSFSEPYKYMESDLKATFKNGMMFEAKGKMPINLGWKSVQKELNINSLEEEKSDDVFEEQIFGDIKTGDVIDIDNISLVSRNTTAPKLHTEATLLTAMENAGNTVDGGEILKGKGIGTQATRASIIKSLFDKGYIANQKKGKTNFLIPTKQGIAVIKVLPSELYSPKITADWENKIAQIIEGNISEEEFMNDFKEFIDNKLDQVINHKLEGIDFSKDKNVICKCPWCNNNIIEGIYKDSDGKKIESVYCTNKECKFSIRKDNFTFVSLAKRRFTLPLLKELITKGQIKVKCKSKTDKEYTAQFGYKKNEKGYVDIVFKPVKRI